MILNNDEKYLNATTAFGWAADSASRLDWGRPGNSEGDLVSPPVILPPIINPEPPVVVSPVERVKPTIDYAWDNAGSKQGKLEHGDLSDDNQPVIHGTAEPGSLLRVIYYDTQEHSVETFVTADAQGHWQLQTEPLTEDRWRVVVQYPGEFEWASTFATGYSTKEQPLKAPVIEFFEDNVGKSQGEFQNGSSTDDITPILHGKTFPKGSILLFASHSPDGEYEFVDILRADAAGNWQAEINGEVGTTLYFRAEDAAGPATSEVFSITFTQNGAPVFQQQIPELIIDGPFMLTPEEVPASEAEAVVAQSAFGAFAAQPIQPTIDYFYDNVGVSQGQRAKGEVTDDRQPVLHGTAEPGSHLTIRYFDDNNNMAYGDATADANGHWQLETRQLPEGTWHARVAYASNTATWSDTFHFGYSPVDPQPVKTTTIDSFSDDFSKVQGDFRSGTATDDLNPVLHGTTTPGSNVYIQLSINSADNFELTGSVKADANGNWEYDAFGFYGYTAYYRASTNNDGNWSDVFTIDFKQNADRLSKASAINALAFDDQGEAALGIDTLLAHETQDLFNTSVAIVSDDDAKLNLNDIAEALSQNLTAAGKVDIEYAYVNSELDLQFSHHSEWLAA